jgi:hypothetical protein
MLGSLSFKLGRHLLAWALSQSEIRSTTYDFLLRLLLALNIKKNSISNKASKK